MNTRHYYYHLRLPSSPPSIKGKKKQRNVLAVTTLPSPLLHLPPALPPLTPPPHALLHKHLHLFLRPIPGGQILTSHQHQRKRQRQRHRTNNARIARGRLIPVRALQEPKIPKRKGREEVAAVLIEASTAKVGQEEGQRSGAGRRFRAEAEWGAQFVALSGVDSTLNEQAPSRHSAST